jgi:uncharacterized protein YjbI with pentapeptide repeats
MEAKGLKVLKSLALDVGAMRRLEELHRNWRLGRPRSQRMMLSDCDLRKLDLSLMDFTDSYFLRCNFERANLRGAVFRDAILTGTTFDEADLTGAVFERADLRGALFHRSDMTRASLASADLRKDFSQAADENSAPACRFRGARLEQTVFIGAKAISVDFAGAFLLEADFSGADLRRTNFNAAQIQAIRLAGAELDGADFSTAAAVDEATRDQVMAASLPVGSAPRLSDPEIRRRLGEHAQWIDSLGQAGRRLDLAGFDLSGFDLRGVNLSAASLSRCLLTRANLMKARLIAADLHGANLSEADLSDADLRGADFSDAHQRGLIMQGARTGLIPGLDLTTRGLRV